jgi:hypothetical protein
VRWTLRRVGLQRESYPLDWVNSFDVRRAAAFVHEADHGFVAHLCASTLHVDRAHPDGERRLYSTRFSLRLPHEFERDRSISHDDLGRRYQRRFDRLRAHCRDAEFVLFLRAVSHEYYEVPGEAEEAYAQAEEELHDRLTEVCGHRRYLLILMSHRQFFHTRDAADGRTVRVNRVVPFENGFYDAVSDEPRGAPVFDFYEVALARVAVLVRNATLPADLHSGIRRELSSHSTRVGRP